MTITSKLTKKDFIRGSFALAYNRPFVKFFTIFFGLCLLTSIVLNMAGARTATPQAILNPLIVSMVLPSIIYFATVKGYKSNKRIGEQMSYTFDQENLMIKGESFSGQLTIDKIFKVSQTKNWILIWQSKQIANIIPRRSVSTEQLKELKIMLDAKKVKNNL